MPINADSGEIPNVIVSNCNHKNGAKSCIKDSICAADVNPTLASPAFHPQQHKNK